MIDVILEKLLQYQKIAITTHVRPDGDAIGSELALGRFLEKLGKSVTILNSDPPPYNLYWLPGIEKVAQFDGSMVQREAVGLADAVVVVDTNAQDRLGKTGLPFRNSNAVSLLIDHHTHPETWFDHAWSEEHAASTGELIYRLIARHDRSLIDTEIATALYTAIMTDTGSFRYRGVTPETHRIIADLLELGDIEPTPIHIALYDTRSMQGLRLLGLSLESLTLCYEGQVGYMVVSQRMTRSAGANLDETEGFVNYALSIEGVNAALLFMELESGTKVSFRSKGDAYVNDWARSFGGGGHRNAAGAFVRKPLQEVVDDVVAAAPKFLKLNDSSQVLPADESLSAEDASYLSSLLDLQSQRPSK